MARGDPRKLKDEAAEHVMRGRWRKALDCYKSLERLETDEGGWPQRVGEMNRRLGRLDAAAEALARAADVYSRRGVLLKAIAVCKLILEIDPRRTEVQDRLATLYAERFAVAPPRAATIMPVVVVPESDRHLTITGPIPAAAPLTDVALGRTIPGSHASREIPAQGGAAVYEIPLELTEEPSRAAETARALLPRTPLFSSLSEDKLRLLIQRVALKHLTAGDVLFRRGDSGDALYVIAAGEVAVRAPVRGGAEVEVARLKDGAFFGEIALLTNQPRAATITAAVDTDLLAIDRALIAALIADSPEVLRVLLRFMRDRLIDTLVETNPLFAPFSGEERRALAAHFVFLEAEPGIKLIAEGTRVAGLFIVLCGEVDVLKGGAVVDSMSNGAVFGEASLITEAPASATIRARSKVLLLELPRADFQQVIMSHPQVLEYIGTLADDRRKVEVV